MIRKIKTMFKELTLEILQKQTTSFEEKKLLNSFGNVKNESNHKLNLTIEKKNLLSFFRNFLLRNQVYKPGILSAKEKKTTSPRFHSGHKILEIKVSTKKKGCPRCKLPAEKTYLGKKNRLTCFCSNCQALFG